MKAVAVFRGGETAARLIDVPMPKLDDVPSGRGVLVRVLRVGVDGTDKEILSGDYGAPPSSDVYLITGHESFGVVEDTGVNVSGLARGDYVVATVRRPGSSLYDDIGTYDMTTDDTYFERGINLRHGFLAEYYVDDPQFIVKVPPELRDVGVLLEPASVIEKGIAQAYEIQRRLRVWRPRTAIVLGAGTIGLLATMALRLRGLDVHTFAREPAPTCNSRLVEALGARYHDTASEPFDDVARGLPNADLIFEATGSSALAFKALEILGKNGVMVLSGVTGGDRQVEIPADRINLSTSACRTIRTGETTSCFTSIFMVTTARASAPAVKPAGPRSSPSCCSNARNIAANMRTRCKGASCRACRCRRSLRMSAVHSRKRERRRSRRERTDRVRR